MVCLYIFVCLYYVNCKEKAQASLLCFKFKNIKFFLPVFFYHVDAYKSKIEYLQLLTRIDVKLSFEPQCRSVGRLVGRSEVKKRLGRKTEVRKNGRIVETRRDGRTEEC